MKSKTVRWCIKAACLLAWAGGSLPAVAAPAPEAVPAWGGIISGEVVAVDAQARYVTVQSGLEQRRFLIGPQTRFSYTGPRSITLADLRPGDAVTIEYRAQDGQPMSRSVTLVPPSELDAPLSPLVVP